jgi:hypothetical protein
MLGGEPIKIFRKVWTLECEEPECKIRSNNNYHFSLVEQKEGRFTKLYELISRLNGAVGTNNFYALDIGLTEQGYFIIEGNSAPGLNELTAEIYAKFLIDKIDLLKG